MIILNFVVIAVGLSITGFSLMFSSSWHARMASLWVLGAAAFFVGGFLSAQMNGGRPYGFDVPIGLDQWKTALPAVEVPKPQPRRLPEPDSAPMV
jgi:hypothetical protein